MTPDTGDEAARVATVRRARIAEARRLRAVDGLSKSQIAERLGVSTGLLSRWLRGVDPPQWTNRPNAKDDLRERARELRRQHHSVPEIAAALGIVRSTAYQWVRDIPLDRDARRALFARRHSSNPEHGRMMAESRWSRYRARRDERRADIAAAAAASLPPLSNVELLRLGALIYWCEGEKDKPWRQSGSIQFINSDPGLIRLFLAFLRAAGVSGDRIRYRVSIHESADVPAAVRWWAGQVGVAPDVFQPTTLKRHRPTTVRRNTGEDYHGCLVVRVLRGRELYWRIDAMVEATFREVVPGRASGGTDME